MGHRDTHRSGERAEDRFGLEELDETVFAPLPAVAGLLVAAEWSVEVRAGSVEVEFPVRIRRATDMARS